MKAMKFFLGALALATASLLSAPSVNAQEDGNRDESGKVVRGPYLTNRLGDNWFLSGGVGLNSGYDAAAFHYGFGVDGNVGKWITPAVGARLGLNGYDLESHGRFFYAHADVLWNISDAIGGYKETRLWDFVPYVHGGVFVDSWHDKEFAAGAGLLNLIRISDAVDVILDFRGNLTEEAGDKFGYITSSVGISINLGKTTNFLRAANWRNPKDVAALDAAAASAAALVAANAALEADKKELQDENKLHADKNAQLQEELTAVKEVVVLKDAAVADATAAAEALKTANAALEVTVNHSLKDRELLQNENKLLADKNAALENELAAAKESALMVANATLEADKKELQNELAIAKAEIRVKDAAAVEAAAAEDALKAANAALETDKQNLQNENKLHADKNAALENELTVTKGELTAAREEISLKDAAALVAAAEADALKAANAALEVDKQNLQNENKLHADKNAELQNELTATKGELTSAREEISLKDAAALVAAAEADALKAANAALEADKQNLQEENKLQSDKNAELQDELVAAKAEVRLMNVEPTSFYFEIGKSTLGQKELEHLDFYIKNVLPYVKDKTITVITGTADKSTGSVKRNTVLCQQRAEYIKKIMVEKYGFNAEDFEIRTNLVSGGNAALSRAVVVSFE